MAILRGTGNVVCLLHSVNVVLVDFEGNRHFVKGSVGQTLRDACVMNNLDIIKDDSTGGGGQYNGIRDDYYTESLFGEGMVGCVFWPAQAAAAHTHCVFLCVDQARYRRSRT